MIFMIGMAVPLTAMSITMDECVNIALKNNADINKQKLAEQIAENDLREQKRSGLGNLKLVGSYNHYNISRTLAPLTPSSIATDPAGVPTTKDLYLVGIVYELPLFTGFARTNAVKISSLQKEIAASMLNLSKEQLIYNVKSIYVNLLGLDAQAESQRKYVEALQALVHTIDQEFALGRKAKIDQLKAQADLKKAEATLQEIVTNRELLMSSFYKLLSIRNLPPLEPVSLEQKVITRISRQDNWLKSGQLSRLQAAELEVKKNEHQVRKARSILYPQVAFNSSYGQNFGPNDDSHPNSGDWENQEVWQVGVNLQWSILDFGVGRAKIRKAQHKERQSRYEQKKIMLELEQSLKEAVDKINLAVSNYESAREELQLTKQTEKIEQVRYEQGASTTNDLLYAKARSQQANSRLISSRYNYITSRFYLDYLLEQGEKDSMIQGNMTQKETSLSIDMTGDQK